MEEAVAEKAKSKQVATLKQNASVLQKSEKRDVPVHTDETLAQMAGVSRDTIQKTRTILGQDSEEQQVYRGYNDRPELSPFEVAIQGTLHRAQPAAWREKI